MCKLKKALYGLKQVPRAWYSRIEKYFLEKKFERIPSNPNFYVKVNGTYILIIMLYVDDLIYTGNSKQLCQHFKKEIYSELKMSDLG